MEYSYYLDNGYINIYDYGDARTIEIWDSTTILLATTVDGSLKVRLDSKYIRIDHVVSEGRIILKNAEVRVKLGHDVIIEIRTPR